LFSTISLLSNLTVCAMKLFVLAVLVAYATADPEAYVCYARDADVKTEPEAKTDCSTDDETYTCYYPAATADNAFTQYGCGACPDSDSDGTADDGCTTCTNSADSDETGCNEYVAPTYNYKCWEVASDAYSEKACTAATEKKCYTGDEAQGCGTCADASLTENCEDCTGDLCNRETVAKYQCYQFTYDKYDGTGVETKSELVDCEGEYAVSCFGVSQNYTGKLTNEKTMVGGCGTCAAAGVDTSAVTYCADCGTAKCNSAAAIFPLLTVLLSLAFWMH